MANSRLEKIGTIYTRAAGLIKSGAKRWEDRPLWFDVYEAFPPKEEPKYDRPSPNLKLQQIFYDEDKIRAMFHKANKNIGSIDLFKSQSSTLTQRFIECYRKIDEKYEGKEDAQKVYDEALQLLKLEKDSKEMESINTTIDSETKKIKKI
ncbi:hypothetical protein HHI36_000420 [Cryptolaemus montrouzieri]|uniref:Small ribosomal subunit protein mS23 n=2 Tax=Cryptolaemus montrouzieri TaxID=559131 RepID=A0ABD2P4Z1_9CUCU